MMHNPKPFIIASTTRTGSTFLAQCLDSHPDIYTERTEPLSPDDRYLKAGFSRAQALKWIWATVGYKRAGCKVQASQMGAALWHYVQHYDVDVIHLQRLNKLAQIVSIHINKHQLLPAHSTTVPTAAPRITIEPDQAVDGIRALIKRHAAMQGYLTGLQVLHVTYEDITGSVINGCIPPETADKITTFLGVDHLALYCDLKKTNTQPLTHTLANYDDVMHAIRAAGLAQHAGEV